MAGADGWLYTTRESHNYDGAWASCEITTFYVLLQENTDQRAELAGTTVTMQERGYAALSRSHKRSPFT